MTGDATRAPGGARSRTGRCRIASGLNDDGGIVVRPTVPAMLRAPVSRTLLSSFARPPGVSPPRVSSWRAPAPARAAAPPDWLLSLIAPWSFPPPSGPLLLPLHRRRGCRRTADRRLLDDF